MCSVEGAKDAKLPSPKLTLSCDGATCEVFLFGATVVSWKPKPDGSADAGEGDERLWMSSLSTMDGSGPIRGGVPIAFPQFADQGPLSLHGFARESLWSVQAAGKRSAFAMNQPLCSLGDTLVQESYVTLFLEDNEQTRALWPHKFRLEYTIQLQRSNISFGLKVTNKSCESTPFKFTACLHSYFRVPDSRKMSLSGLKGLTYTDKVDGMKVKKELNATLELARASAESGGFVDRIYNNLPCGVPGSEDAVLHDSSSDPAVRFTIKHFGFPDTVVYNPWETSKLGDKGPDFDDDGYLRMICVEAAAAGKEKELAPGESWEGSQTILLRQDSTSGSSTQPSAAKKQKK